MDQDTTNIAPLEYASSPTQMPMTNRLLRIAAGFGLLPLVTGILCLACWIGTGALPFAIAGLFTIYGGIICTLIAGSCLLAHFICTVARRDPTAARRWMPNRYQWLLLLLLGANFPVAFGCMAMAFYIDDFYVVTVVNNSPARVDEIVVSFGLNRSVPVRTLNPGESARHHVNMAGNNLHFHVVENGHIREGAIDYDNDPPHDVQVTIQGSGVTAAMAPGGNSRTHIFPHGNAD